MEIDRRPKVFTCKLCGKRILGKGRFGMHMRYQHPKSKPELISSTAKINEPLKPSFHRTSQIYPKNQEFGTSRKQDHPCLFCGKVLQTQHQLELHIRTHTKEKTFQCPKCKISFMFQQNLGKHMKSHSSHDLRCSYCELSFTMKSSLHDHIKSCHATEVTTDTKTDVPSSRVDAIFQKFTTFKPRLTPSKKHQCSKCGKVFPWPSMLQRHMVVHTKPRPVFNCINKPDQKAYKPMYQEVSSSRSQNFEVSITANQEEVSVRFKLPNPKNFQCQYCKKTFPSARSLRQHVVVHSEVRPFICSICSMGFNWKHALDRHSKILHSKKCDQCDLMFTLQQSLEQHIASAHSFQPTHDPDNNHKSPENFSDVDPEMPRLQPYDENEVQNSCRPVSRELPAQVLHKSHICKNVFPSKNRLHKHSLKHTQVNQFPCVRCKLTFNSRQLLLQHSSDVHCVVRILKCKKCNLSFSNENLFKEHVLTHPAQVKLPPDFSGQRQINPPVKQQRYQSLLQVVPIEVPRASSHAKEPGNFRNRYHYRCPDSIRESFESLNVPEKTVKEIFNCKHCGKHFFRREVLTTHLFSHAKVHHVAG